MPENSNQKRCRNCSTLVNDGDYFCPKCGTGIQIVCEQCGATGESSDLICRKCGAPLTEPDLISAARAFAHRLNNILSIALTNSQLSLDEAANLPGKTGDKLQRWLRDIIAAIGECGKIIHEFQKILELPAEERIQVIIPVCAANPQSSSNNEPPGLNKNLETISRVRNISILIVDDEEKIRHAMSYALTLAGHHVITASDGQEALNLFQTGSYDMVLVDLKMPGMDGWELARNIKRIDPNTIVVLMTGWRVRLDDKLLKEKIVDKVLVKPFQLSEITDLILYS